MRKIILGIIALLISIFSYYSVRLYTDFKTQESFNIGYDMGRKETVLQLSALEGVSHKNINKLKEKM